MSSNSIAPSSPVMAGVRRVFGFLVLALPLGAMANGHSPYLVDAGGGFARSGSGLCWRTGYWSPAAASTMQFEGRPAACQCEPSLLPAGSCNPAEAPIAAPPPATSSTAVAPPAPVQAAPLAAPVQKIKLSAEARFEFNHSVLTDESRKNLDELARQISGMTLEVILAVGHADRIGSEAYNQGISEKRAAVVKEYLIGKGVAANRIYTEGKGEKQPRHAGSCDAEGAESRRNARLVECLQTDRRVEIEAIGTR